MTIEIDGEPFDIWTTFVGDQTKKTLLMTHGYMLAGVMAYFKTFKKLTEHYRVIVFDHGSFGLNTRRAKCPALENPPEALPDACEMWLLEWWTKYVDALELPEKFYLAGHSMGGHQAMLYAS